MAGCKEGVISVVAGEQAAADIMKTKSRRDAVRPEPRVRLFVFKRCVRRRLKAKPAGSIG